MKSVDAFPRTSDGALPVMGVERGLEEGAAVVRLSTWWAFKPNGDEWEKINNLMKGHVVFRCESKLYVPRL